jgi:Prokaryotic E2 family E
VTLAQSLWLRLEQEQPLLLQAYPTARITFDTLVVVLPDYQLPAGWSHTVTDVLFAIPPNYPVGQPDNVCTRPDLTLQGGGAPGNNQGVQVHDGRAWLQFSYHLEPGDWHPSADPATGSTLADYLTGALTRFDETS